MFNFKPKKEARSSFKLLREYVTFLRDHQALADSTIATRRNNVAPFLTALKERGLPSKICNLHPHTIHDYIIKTARPLSRGMRKHLVSSLRSFLRFAHLRGYLNRNLVEAVPIITTYQLGTVPRAVPWNFVKQMLKAPNRRTPLGRRDYAILQLLATYGIRRKHALSLRFCDIKWKEGVIHFPAIKRGRPLCFPLEKKVAAALLDYIRRGRPQSFLPQVFLIVKGKPRPFTKNTYGNSMGNWFKRAGIKLHGGLHSIRHAFATRLMERGTPIKTIADLLGHRNIDTTFIYTKVDIQRLRALAREWPEVLS
ncbi:MAG: hypothetical protein A3G33_08320 [Omnitrophica bacterium RIFCSPLOWO2_12_FULL_44_17]|uniref:Tyr recombinase domain-containing protein n=1 Tax=Candidatus Danuiimicrobium aquiferis TaxID=1801832 RepID=A0A1G1KX47_9BACT|nr:MAG: hypothetical protein A3B72_03540 [Omnitrophica bacterium RIFCSPHIGHO2_02_FULL_45_28]OGW90529.1 MAG: hypothetical protein A3E74_03060 [Omnitrophica bacterium RIFCSPHIGHO2_12_FULL_44_12]OGW97169.1 MAG: hypothetical protein A3G33_08320 [Omnitrophica bacterium RIFCSPLOWO2_12_FULL_44_17]